MPADNYDIKMLNGAIAHLGASLIGDIESTEGCEAAKKLQNEDLKPFVASVIPFAMEAQANCIFLIQALHSLSAFCHVKQFTRARLKLGLDRIAFLVKETRTEDHKEALEELYAELHNNEL